MSSNIARKKGKKNRNHGQNLRKVQRSRWGSYEAIFAASRRRKLARMEARKVRLAWLKTKRDARRIQSAARTLAAD